MAFFIEIFIFYLHITNIFCNFAAQLDANVVDRTAFVLS